MDNLVSQIVKTCEIIHKSSTFLITSCENPDGDSIASQLILVQFIRQIKDRQQVGYRVDVLNRLSCPPLYKFLQGSESIVPLEKATALAKYEVGMMTDGGPERSGAARPLFAGSDVKIVVDHHLVGSRDQCDIELVSVEVSSTCELLYKFLEIPGSPLSLNLPLAEMFYVGIIFDTGSFLYDLTRPSTHRIAAELVETGIDFSKISERVLLECSPSARLLQGRVLTDLRYSHDRRIAWGQVSRRLLRRVQAGPGDMEGLVNMINFTRGVELAILFHELAKNVWKISLRSRGTCNVAELARALSIQGGGHRRAAGCTLSGRLGKVRRQVLDLASEFLKPQTRDSHDPSHP